MSLALAALLASCGEPSTGVGTAASEGGGSDAEVKGRAFLDVSEPSEGEMSTAEASVRARAAARTPTGLDGLAGSIDPTMLTPEALAMQAAQSCSGRVLDATCGLGGLAIALARQGCSVVACELSERRIAMARHNARLYGVEIDFRLQDATTVTGEFDHVVVDPPWGGRDYGALTLKDLPLVESLLDRAPSVHLKLPVSFQINSLPRVQKVRPMMDDRLRFLWVTC